MPSRDLPSGDGKRPVGDAHTGFAALPSRVAIRRRAPYPGAGGTVYVPQPIWEETLEWMRHYGRHDSEGLVFWGGVTDGSASATVTCLIAPNHAAMGGTVKLPPELSRALVRTLRDLDLKLIAQIHSHHGPWVGHSRGDDEHAASFHDGYLSLVVPDFGAGVTSLNECGVHEFRKNLGAFVRLDGGEAGRRLCLEPVLVVLQDGPAPPVTPDARKVEQQRWYRRWWNGLRKKLSISGLRRRSAGSLAQK